MTRRLTPLRFCALLLELAALTMPARGTVLWQEAGPITVCDNGEGTDILHGAVQRDETARDTLYFKFRVNPLSDASREPYLAAFQLFEGHTPRLGVGNSLQAWAYSAFNTDETGTNNTVPGDMDLHSANPEWYQPVPYELPRRGIERTIVFKIQFVPGGDDLVTVWVNPNLHPGATDENQPASLTTRFSARCSFNQIHQRHEGNGPGWVFSDMAIATSFNDFIIERFWQTWWFRSLAALGVFTGVGAGVRLVEKRKFQQRLRRAEQERALERERARIAQDLHDELGSTLTRLSLLSNLIKTDKDHPEQVAAHADKLSQAADQTVRALEEIVWAVRPGSDTLQSLADYIAHFANELFDGHSTRCRLDLPPDLPALPLPPDLRHNIFLIVKEALTNALRHAAAREVQVQAKVSDSTLEIQVRDDGRGFDPASQAEGRRNGLGNLRRRAAAIGGVLDLHSAPGRGTTLALKIHLPRAPEE
jgi:signal transduction histidine kinase